MSKNAPSGWGSIAMSRRQVLRVGSCGLIGGLTLPRLLELQAEASTGKPASAKSCIFIFQEGGPSTIDLWDLKPDAPAEIRGEFKPIATNVDGIQICEHLPKTAQTCDKMTIVRSLNHTIPSHGPATVFMQTGNKPTPALQYPVLGSLTTKLMPQEQGVPPFVSFGEMRNGNAAGYLGTAYNPFVIEGDGGKGKGDKASFRVRGITLPNGFTLDQLQDRDSLLNDFDETFKANDKAGDLVDGLDAFHKKALEILRSDKTKKAFDLNQEKQQLRESYGLNGFGQGALAARRLVEAGVRFVTVSLGGWDTHVKNFETLSKQRSRTASNCCRARSS